MGKSEKGLAMPSAPAASPTDLSPDGSSRSGIGIAGGFRGDFELLIREAVDASEAEDSHDLRDDESRAMMRVFSAEADAHAARLILYCMHNGRALLNEITDRAALAMEARQGGDEGSVHDSAVPKGSAQPNPKDKA